MANNKQEYFALIDQGKIKIVTDFGLDLEKSIIEKQRTIKKYKFLKNVAGYIILGACLSSWLHSAFSILLSIENFYYVLPVSVVLFFFFAIALDDNKTTLSNKEAALNVAKYSLQKDILELEKTLAEHTQEIEAIYHKKTFDFNEKQNASPKVASLFLNKNE